MARIIRALRAHLLELVFVAFSIISAAATKATTGWGWTPAKPAARRLRPKGPTGPARVVRARLTVNVDVREVVDVLTLIHASMVVRVVVGMDMSFPVMSGGNGRARYYPRPIGSLLFINFVAVPIMHLLVLSPR